MASLGCYSPKAFQRCRFPNGHKMKTRLTSVNEPTLTLLILPLFFSSCDAGSQLQDGGSKPNLVLTFNRSFEKTEN
jgi:hypothetical protein